MKHESDDEVPEEIGMKGMNSNLQQFKEESINIQIVDEDAEKQS